MTQRRELSRQLTKELVSTDTIGGLNDAKAGRFHREADFRAISRSTA